MTIPAPAHTPGPWQIVSDGENELKVKGPADEWVADCTDGFWSDEEDAWIMAPEAEANARLIAAAPALVVALQGLIADADESLNRSVKFATLTNARAALSLALGEQ